VLSARNAIDISDLEEEKGLAADCYPDLGKSAEEATIRHQKNQDEESRVRIQAVQRK